MRVIDLLWATRRRDPLRHTRAELREGMAWSEKHIADGKNADYWRGYHTACYHALKLLPK